MLGNTIFNVFTALCTLRRVTAPGAAASGQCWDGVLGLAAPHGPLCCEGPHRKDTWSSLTIAINEGDGHSSLLLLRI